MNIRTSNISISNKNQIKLLINAQHVAQVGVSSQTVGQLYSQLTLFVSTHLILVQHRKNVHGEKSLEFPSKQQNRSFDLFLALFKNKLVKSEVSSVEIKKFLGVNVGGWL